MSLEGFEPGAIRLQGSLVQVAGDDHGCQAGSCINSVYEFLSESYFNFHNLLFPAAR